MINRIKNYFLILLFGFIVIAFIYYTAKIDSLEKKLNQTTHAIDTVKVTVVMHDTIAVIKSDTISMEIEKRGDSVFVYKNMHTTFNQPLFDLTVWAFSRNEKFKFDIKYKSLKLYFQFKDKYDLQKGFTLKTDPDIGLKYSVDWGQYVPLKKEKNFRINVGLGYSKELGPFLLNGIQYKTNILGVFLKENSWGLYFQKSFGVF